MYSILRWFKSSFFVLMMGIASFLMPTHLAQAVTIFVNNAATGTNDGLTWPNAFVRLQDALAYASVLSNGVTQIWVAKSTSTPATPYRPDKTNASPSGSNDRSAAFGLVTGVSIFGGAIAGEATLANREKDGKNTILTGEIGNTSILTDNSYHVVTTLGTTSPPMTPFNTFLDGFTIRNGFGQLASPNSHTSNGGAGILCKDNGDARFVNCVITNNFAGHDRLGEVQETDVNKTSGAGAQAKNASPVFVACTFIANKRVPDWFIYGAGFSAVNGPGKTAKLISCTFRDNVACHGGGVAVRSGSGLEMTNCLLLNNSLEVASGTSGPLFGGGVSVDGTAGAVTITNCSFVLNNTEPLFLGGGYAQWDNPAGGICKLHNCIFWKNFRRAPPLTILNQIYVKTNSGELQIRWSDVEGGLTGITNPATPPAGSSPTSPTVYENNQDVDPQFWGPQVIVAGGTLSDSFNWALKCTSPCRDVKIGANNGNSLVPADTYDIDNDSVSTGEETPDRDRRIRIVNSIVDQGCFERYFCDGDANGDGVVNIDDLVLVITTWGQTGGPGDVKPAICGIPPDVVNIDDLVWVITHWGDCPGGPVQTAGGIPASFQECWDSCSAEFEAGTPKWHECMDACILSLCRLGYTQYCP